MSHSKMTKRGKSVYLDLWNPEAKKYILTCKLCRHRGYSPVIEEEAFTQTPPNGVIYYELKKTLPPLSLDEFGRCEQCARLQKE